MCFYFSDKCDSLSKLSDIVGSQSEIIPGWTNDGLEGGPWRLPKWKNVWEKCGEGSGWYGWKPHGGVGSISTTFTASGRAELSFGNCWDAGTVKVYLDGTEIASAGPELHKTVAFDFNTGSVLSIYDEGYNSVIQISKFKILDCEGKQSRFILQGNGIEFEFCSLTSSPFCRLVYQQLLQYRKQDIN